MEGQETRVALVWLREDAWEREQEVTLEEVGSGFRGVLAKEFTCGPPRSFSLGHRSER